MQPPRFAALYSCLSGLVAITQTDVDGLRKSLYMKYLSGVNRGIHTYRTLINTARRYAVALCLFVRLSVRHKSTAEFVIKQIALRLQFTMSSTMSVHWNWPDITLYNCCWFNVSQIVKSVSPLTRRFAWTTVIKDIRVYSGYKRRTLQFINATQLHK